MKKKNIVLVSVVGVVAVAAIGLVLCLPRINYSLGESAFEKGDYESSVAYFGRAGDYNDTPERLGVATQALAYSLGDEAFTNGDYQLAVQKFTEANGYNDSVVKLTEAQKAVDYQEGQASYDAGDYLTAAELFISAGDYSDASLKVSDSYYMYANKLKDDGDYVNASDYYVLSEKDDIRDVIFECGTSLLVQELYDDAVYVFGLLEDDEECCNYMNYSQGMSYMNSNHYTLAISSFSNSGGVEDSDEQYKEANYQAGLVNIGSGDLTSARTELGRIPGYKEADYYLEVCDLLDAEECYDNGYLNSALSMFEALPEDLEYDGISVSERINTINSHSSFLSLCGVWEFEEGSMETYRDFSYTYDGWSGDLANNSAQPTFTMGCIINDDGDVTVNVNTSFKIFTNFNSYQEFLETDTKRINYSETFTNAPYSIQLDDYTTISISSGVVNLTYSKTVTPSTYYSETMKTTVKFSLLESV